MARADWIPVIEDREMAVILARATPMVRVGGTLWSIHLPHLRKQAFTWSPKLRNRIDEDLIEVLDLIQTYHSWAYYGFFKPSVAEVLAQIPKELRKQVVGFTCDGPRTASDLNMYSEALNAGYHVAATTLYKAAGT